MGSTPHNPLVKHPHILNRNGGFAFDWLILSLALVGFALNLLLLYQRVAGGAGVAGCGGGDCSDVLASRWAVVLGVPVTVGGMLVYLALMLAVTPRFKRAQPALAGVLLGAACWFVFVQAVILRRICPWCMAAHGVGLAVFAAILLARSASAAGKTGMCWAAAALLGIGLLQVYGPLPAGHRLAEAPAAIPAPVHERGSGRKVSFDGGRKRFDMAALPRLGAADARHVLVEYFDYPCAACRKMAGYTAALLSRHPRQVALVLLPMPLESSCNPHLRGGNEHAGSCDIARIALAVWRVDPGAFPRFHEALLADPGPDAARRLASDAIGSIRLDAALRDPWIDELIQANIRDWRVFSAGTDKLPKLLIRDRRMLHGLPASEADFIRVMERELGL